MMQIRQRLKRGRQHVVRFIVRQRPLRQNLQQVLFRVLHYQEQQPHVAQPALAHVIETDEMWMNQLCRHSPPRELQIRAGRIRRNQLYGRLLTLSLRMLREEHSPFF